MSRAILGVHHGAPGFAMPEGACDCHTHVFGPAGRFPFAADRLYTPGDALVEDLFAHQLRLGLDRVVIVQPSCYGTDNACTVAGLRALGPARARGVAVIADAADEAALAALHAAGIRGVRLNLETSGNNDPEAARRALRETAARVAPFGWHVQVFTNLGVIGALREVVETLPVPLVVDHFGRARGDGGIAQPGFDALLGLVRDGRAYVKLSAPHRASALPGYADVLPLARALIAANPDRMLWGSDWPHPGGAPPGGRRSPDGIEAFRPEDDGAALTRLGQWAAGDAALLRRILVDNPARLYGF
ncbi:MAG TPA: amidohydrolase family protein [Roseomonas sp.]